jgi:dolichyl-diphosphooligosaccharide--protein glycosyltransferase
VLVVMALGAWLRLDNLEIWRDKESRFFQDERPLLLSVDGYYYLGLARALLDGKYEASDPNRAVPDGVDRPMPPPLLSTLTALGVRLTRAEIDWVAVLLPPLLGLLVALPVYALGAGWGGMAMGWIAALFTLCAPFYVFRSVAGWYDTDCLNLAFPLAIAYFLLRFSAATGRARLLFLGAALATWLGFLWWWDHGRAEATFAFVLPLGVALVLHYRRRPEERWLWAALLAACLVGLFFFGQDLFDRAVGATRYVTKESGTAFPVAAGNVVEQNPADWARVARDGAGSAWTLLVALAGLGLLAWRRRAELLFLSFPIFVSLLSFQAVRFLMFMAPLVGLGVASAVVESWRRLRPPALGRAVAAGMLLLASWPFVSHWQRDNVIEPRRFPFQVEAMKAMAEKTPADAVIWTDWGHGYPLQYYGERGTLSDGGHRSNRLLYLLSVPLASRDFRTAANWIAFFTAHGPRALTRARGPLGEDWSSVTRNLLRLLGAGPRGARSLLEELGMRGDEADDWVAFLFPRKRRPVYVFLDADKIRTPWFFYGTWDFDKGTGTQFAHTPFFRLEREGSVVRNEEIVIDLEKGSARYGRHAMPLSRLITSEGEHSYRRGGLSFRFDPVAGFGLLYDDNVGASVGHKLYVGTDVDPRYFERVISRYPLYRVWKVRSDVAPGPSGPRAR